MSLEMKCKFIGKLFTPMYLANYNYTIIIIQLAIYVVINMYIDLHNAL